VTRYQEPRLATSPVDVLGQVERDGRFIMQGRESLLQTPAARPISRT
jgi:hypothetical protein